MICAGKALNNHRTAIRDALIKIFVEERTPANDVENKVIAPVVGDTSMQAVMDLQANGLGCCSRTVMVNKATPNTTSKVIQGMKVHCRIPDGRDTPSPVPRLLVTISPLCDCDTLKAKFFRWR